MTSRLSCTIALVTGGSSGLGAGAAKCLIRQGARVLIADLAQQEEAFRRWTATLTGVKIVPSGDSFSAGAGPAVSFVETDVTDPSQVGVALDAIESRFGEPVNAVVNCAGIAVARRTLSKKGVHPLAEFTKTLTVNTIGTFNVGSLAAERMSQRIADADGLRGCIINTSSIAAYEGQIGQVAYAASKGAVIGMTLPMARDLASIGIRVMAIVRAAVINVYPLIVSDGARRSRVYSSLKCRRLDSLQLRCSTAYPTTSRESLEHRFRAPAASAIPKSLVT